MSNHPIHPRTAVLNQKEKNKSKLARLNAINWLAKHFPESFCNQKIIRPLKIGIIDDILQYSSKAAADGISKSKLREAVVVFTRRIDYLTCLKAREMRVDLKGNATSPVSEEDAERAALAIRKRVEKSARNARKNLAGKSPSYYQKSERPLPAETSHNKALSDNNGVAQESARPSYYPDRLPAYSSQHATTPLKKASTISIKHKTTRTFDPDAVARLKAKLGLNREAMSTKE